MNEHVRRIITQSINGKDIRTVTIEDEVFVALPDYIHHIKHAVDSIVTLSKQQEEQVMAMSDLIKAFHEVLEEKYPEILDDVTLLTHRKLKAT